MKILVARSARRGGRGPAMHRESRRVEPVVAWIELGLPAHPVLAALVGEQVLLLEPHLECELFRPRADEEDVVGAIHDRLGDRRRGRHILEGADGAGALGWAVHDAGVELNTGRPAKALGSASARSRTSITGIASASLGSARPAAAAAPAPTKSRREMDMKVLPPSWALELTESYRRGARGAIRGRRRQAT